MIEYDDIDKTKIQKNQLIQQLVIYFLPSFDSKIEKEPDCPIISY